MGAAIIAAILGILGTLTGIVIGHYLAISSEREQMIVNYKKEECRELLSAFAACLLIHLRSKSEGYMSVLLFQAAIDDAEGHAVKTIWDRIFIRPEIEAADMADKWFKLCENYRATHDGQAFAQGVHDLSEVIVGIATKSAYEKSRLERFIDASLAEVMQG